MGRLRNLSASFKAAAFSHSRDASESQAPQPGSFTTLNVDSRSNNASPAEFNGHGNPKEPPAAVREASSSSIPTSSTTLRDSRSVSRPTSMLYTPPTIGLDGRDMQIDELLPVFSFLSSHANKLYQEGYFLKLNDLDTSGKPNADRNWTECFAQLVGTVLSLWDAAALDAAGQDGEVAPTFINLADASIKMIETLPTRNAEVQPLQNVLSISTAGKNRYLLHFNSLHSLTQWTAGIRLSMFEHSSLQELYTGSLIAGKGKHLNSIRTIMERTKFKHEDWARVRFGAGTPWRRCWCVVEPPDEKEWQRAAKTMKKRSAYERPQYPKGDIKFYDTKKTKKVTPIATITDAYSAYAIYPQSKPLIDQSTLVKVEGKITIHSNPESKTEGFVFVMPELHPAVSGFEMMLRWLFPVYDSFHLYGRPNRLIAETLDTKGLMFAMPKERRYGYLDIIDVAALIHTDGSNKWSEREWRKQMKEVTARRISAARENGQVGDLDAQRSKRNSMGSRTGSRNGVRYEDLSPTPSRGGHQYNMSTDAVFATQRKVTAPAVMGGLTAPPSSYHNRSASESIMASPSKGRRQNSGYVPSRLSMDHVDSPQHMDMDISPVPSAHHNYGDSLRPGQTSQAELLGSRNSSDSDLQIERTRSHAEDLNRDMRQSTPPGPVAPPPEFQHQPMDRPQKRPEVRPDVIRQKSRLSNATLDQMVQSSKMNKDSAAGIAAATAWRTGQENQPPRGVGHETPKPTGMSANQPSKAMVADGSYSPSPADIRPPEVRQPSEHLITLPPPLAQSRSTSESSVRRKPVPPPVPAAAPPPIPTRMQSSESASKYSESNYNHDPDESPDYASTVRKSEDEVSIPKRRSGVLKTVGDVGASSTGPAGPARSDVPDIDFGPTRALTPGPSRPSTAMGVVGSRSPLNSPAETTPERRSRTPEDVTPEIKPARPGHSRGPSYAWQPATAIGRISPGPSLSPEEFVQQRFNAANYPSGYVPYRSSSASKVEQAIAAAPKKLQKKRDSTGASRNSLLGMDYSANLSAREQEHVARMTGGPLLNLGERNRTPDPSVGLIGAIEAREQEKRHIREGVSGHMVQAAVAQRHQHAQAQAQAQQAAERAYAQQYGYAPQHQQPQQQQQYTSWGQPIQQSPPQQQYYQQQQQQWQNQYGAPRQQQFQQQQQGQQSPYNQQKFGGFY